VAAYLCGFGGSREGMLKIGFLWGGGGWGVAYVRGMAPIVKA
jgi:hypothetical protein